MLLSHRPVLTLVAIGCLMMAVVPSHLGAEAKTGPKSSSVWNTNIDWIPWDQALKQGKDLNKPVMMLIHKTWCAACKALRTKFIASAEIELLAEHFVMANIEDDDEPSEEKYSPQGSYSPRIMFLTPKGEVSPVQNRAVYDPQHPHFYGTAEEIVQGMLEALKTISGVRDVNEL